MKTLSQILWVLVLTGLMPAAQAQEVSIADPGLNAVIRDALQKPAGPLTALDLDNNQLTDVSFLSGLTNLTRLYLAVNQLTNFSFLSGLTSLTTLDLGGNHLTSLSLPAGLMNLTTLYLGYNQLTNFSFL